MPWYKQGQISVTQNSNAVIGAGTAFLANSRVGDAFRGPDGAWYEVINIASDTAMAIAPNYQGASNAAGIYALAPMQGYVKDSADALRALVNTYGSKLAALGTTGNYDILPPSKGGTGITNLSAVMQEMLGKDQSVDARYVISAAKSGINNDINALHGLTTPIGTAQGGTGGNTPAASRVNLGLKSAAVADVLGTVSQSGGIPTGSLMERGANGNGEYEKYSCGTMICRRASGSFVLQPGDYASYFSILWYYTLLWNYPMSFIAPPVIYGNARAQGKITEVISGDVGNSAGGLFICERINPAGSANNYILGYTAIGRWF